MRRCTPCWSPASNRTLWSTLKPECFQERMSATTSSVILSSAWSSAKTSCSQSLRKGSVASLGIGKNVPSGKNTPSVTRAWMCGCAWMS